MGNPRKLGTNLIMTMQKTAGNDGIFNQGFPMHVEIEEPIEVGFPLRGFVIGTSGETVAFNTTKVTDILVAGPTQTITTRNETYLLNTRLGNPPNPGLGGIKRIPPDVT